MLVSFMGGEDVMPGREELVAANLPDYPRRNVLWPPCAPCVNMRHGCDSPRGC